VALGMLCQLQAAAYVGFVIDRANLGKHFISDAFESIFTPDAYL